MPRSRKDLIMLRSSSVNLTERMLLGMSDSEIESLERENVVPLTAVMLRTLCSVTEPGIKLRGSTVSLNESSRKELSKLNVKFRRVGANRSGVNFFTCLPLPLEIEITSTPLTSVIESEVTVKKVVSNVSASSRVALTLFRSKADKVKLTTNPLSRLTVPLVKEYWLAELALAWMVIRVGFKLATSMMSLKVRVSSPSFRSKSKSVSRGGVVSGRNWTTCVEFIC